MNLRDKLIPWWNAFLNLLYPSICTCIVCERTLPEEYLQRMKVPEMPESRLWLCDSCEKHVQPIMDLDCVVCGKGSDWAGDQIFKSICHECQSHQRPFVFARAAVRYRGTAKDLIRILKFESNKESLTWLGEWLCQAWNRHYAGLPIDYIVPVPLHPERLRQRGFNQAYVLAEILREYSKIPFLDPLQRIQSRSSQASRTRFERLQSLEGVFLCNQGFHDKISSKNVLLVDDVFTTGATVEACTIELLRNGCAAVWVLTVAR